MRRPRAPHVISAAYLILGSLYIAFSDRVVARVAADSQNLSDLQTYKGWGFVLVTAGLLYGALQVHEARQRKGMEELRIARDEAQTNLSYKNALLRELHHRVKNNLQLILSMLRLGTAYHGEDSSKQLMDSLHDRIFAIALVHEHVYKSDRIDCLPVGPFVEELARYLAQLDTRHSISITTEVEENVVVPLDEAVPIGVIVQEAVRNAIEHAFQSCAEDVHPEVRVRAAADRGQQCVIEVRDNGVGFDRSRTKTQLGFVFMEATAKQIGGTLNVTSSPDGTSVRFATAGSPRPDM